MCIMKKNNSDKTSRFHLHKGKIGLRADFQGQKLLLSPLNT
jgi:hypothetical protein